MLKIPLRYVSPNKGFVSIWSVSFTYGFLMEFIKAWWLFLKRDNVSYILLLVLSSIISIIWSSKKKTESIIKSFYIWCFSIRQQGTNWPMNSIACSLTTCYKRKFTASGYFFGILICLWAKITCECLKVSMSIYINNWLKLNFIKWRVYTVN